MAKTSLTDAQLTILSAAAQRDDIRIELLERLRGGAAKAVLSTLLAKSLIETMPELGGGQGNIDREGSGQTGYRISREGLAAIGIENDAERNLSTPRKIRALRCQS